MADDDQTPSPQSPLSSSPSSLPPSRKTYELTACSIYYAKPAAPSVSGFLLTRPCCRPAPPPDYILRDVSLTARPGEVLAVVGPSGAGKSTLLDILSARTLPSHGLLLLNSLPLHPASFRKLSAHVPQLDSSLPLLTVSETFAFASSLLSPRNKSTTAADAVASLLCDLRLSHAAHTRVSGGLSGGERRRVSIGLALLRDPGVLLLDEPTSGLDSSSAHLVLQTLRAAAAARAAAVVLSIHQPSSRLLSSVDSLLLLSKGSVVHFGSLASLDAHLLSLGLSVPAQLNPLEYAMELLHQLPHPKPTTPSVSLPRKQEETKPASPSSTWETPAYSSSRAGEIGALYGRSWKVVYRTKQLLLTNFLEALLVGLLLGTLYINAGYGEDGARKRLGLFAFTLTFLLSATTETLPIFVCERPILIREASSGLYRLSSHVVAATLVFLPYLLAVALLYSATVYFLAGLCAAPAAFATFVLIVWAVVLTANSFVLFVSSFAPDYIAGTSLVTVSLAGFFLFSGYFLTKESMPAYWVFMHYMSPYKYALDAMLANEYACAGERCFGWGDDGECAVKGRDVLEHRGLRAEERWTGLQVLVGFFVLYRVLYWAVLSRRASMSKK
ncbi:ABC transporter G family member 4-like [Ananas comosus]|uniref:ABC transporter G family member 4-like n=1 Tax=Ananas comosus TaxID=4615 RepID=A0A6P5EG54_ANACO|nr:ABC transporter G family member 4-like [Ananas comosus]